MKRKFFIHIVIAFFVFVNCCKADSGNGGIVSENKIIKKVSAADDYFRSVTSGDWNNPMTWESSPDSLDPWVAATSVPGLSAKHVVIQGPDSVWLTTNITTINLTILSGAKLNALANTMTLTSRFNLLGTAFFYQGGTVYPVPGTEQVLDPTSTYVYNGTQVGLSAAYPEFGNLLFKPSSGSSGTFQNTNAAAPFFNGLVVRGNLTIDLQQPLARDISFGTGPTGSRTHTIDGDLIIANNRTILIIQRAAPAGTATATVNIGGNLNIYSGFLYALGYSDINTGTAIINLTGNIYVSDGNISATPVTATAGIFIFNFNGSTPQSVNNGGIPVDIEMHKVNINNIAGILFNNTVSVFDTLHFVKGIIKTTNLNLLTMKAGSAVSNASDSGFVHGPVKKVGDTEFTFPVGKTGTGYVPIGIGVFFGSTANDEFTAEYIRANARGLAGGITVTGLERVSGCEYWTLDRGLATPTSADVTVYWNANSPCWGNDPYVTEPSTLTVAHHNGSSWNSFATNKNVSPVSTTTAGSVTWLGATEFSPFSLGSTSFGDNPLPITINYFNGTKQNSKHFLNWKLTCNTTPFANIEIEHSTDGINFKSIYSIYATALRCQQPFDFTDDQPAKGINYYRIKLIDADGKITYSSLVSLINAAKGAELMNIAPNPVVNGRFDLKISTAEKTNMELLITDMQGRLVQKRPVTMIAGFNTIPMNVSNLAAGTYQLFVNAADGRTRVLRFVIQ